MLRWGRSIDAVPKPIADENVRAERLLDAQDKAAQLFDEIERREMIRPGVGEQELSDEIRDLAARLLGVTGHWHRRIVRAGENTLQPFREHPPDRVVADGDIVFLDLGPIFEEWEADFGRTFVLSDDPDKLAVRDALPRVWRAGRDHFESHPLLGEFPHRKVVGNGVEWYITPGSDKPMRRKDPNGLVCHWILEIHLNDSARGFGGFYEQLLDLP